MWAMSIFVILRVTDIAALKAAIEKEFAENHFDLGRGQWLVSSKLAANEVSDKLGITGDNGKSVVGPAMVVKIESYFGRASKDIWDWIKAKLETTSG